MLDTNGLFVTNDLYNATLLVATRKTPYRGCFLGEDKRTVHFRFVNSPEIQDILLDYTYGAEIVARDFVEAHRFISGQIRQARREAGANSNGGAR